MAWNCVFRSPFLAFGGDEGFGLDFGKKKKEEKQGKRMDRRSIGLGKVVGTFFLFFPPFVQDDLKE